MKYLEAYGFNSGEIKNFSKSTSEFLVDKLQDFDDLVSANLNYLKDLGVENFKEIFTKHAEIFLMDNKAFEDIFQKYDREDLIDKLKKNPDLVEQL